MDILMVQGQKIRIINFHVEWIYCLHEQIN